MDLSNSFIRQRWEKEKYKYIIFTTPMFKHKYWTRYPWLSKGLRSLHWTKTRRIVHFTTFNFNCVTIERTVLEIMSGCCHLLWYAQRPSIRSVLDWGSNLAVQHKMHVTRPYLYVVFKAHLNHARIDSLLFLSLLDTLANCKIT